MDYTCIIILYSQLEKTRIAPQIQVVPTITTDPPESDTPESVHVKEGENSNEGDEDVSSGINCFKTISGSILQFVVIERLIIGLMVNRVVNFVLESVDFVYQYHCRPKKVKPISLLKALRTLDLKCHVFILLKRTSKWLTC